MHRYRDATLGRRTREEALKLLVVVAEEGGAGAECAGHLFKVEACAFDLVDTEALQESALVDVAESVAIVEGLGRRYRDVAASYLLDASDGFTHRLGGGEGGDIAALAGDVVVGEAAIETLVELGCEGIGAHTL